MRRRTTLWPMSRSSLCGGVLLLALSACTHEHEPEKVDCTKFTDLDTFTVGLEKAGRQGTLNFRLMTITPNPPANGDNTWNVEIRTLTSGVVGAPVDGATLQVTPYMPEHDHVSPVTVGVSPMTEPGQYKLDPVNMWMPSVWETTIRATPSGATESDSAMYRFCLPE